MIKYSIAFLIGCNQLKMLCYIQPIFSFSVYWKNDLVGLNSNSDGKWTNFLVKSIRILVEITRILIQTIILVKIRILVDFTRNIVLSIKIPIISTRILINLTRKFWFVHFQPEIFFNVLFKDIYKGAVLFYTVILHIQYFIIYTYYNILYI